MPFIDADDNQIGLRAPMGAPSPDLLAKEDVSLSGAMFRKYNDMTSLYNYVSDRSGLKDEPGYSSEADIRGTKYESDYLDRFVGSGSPAETSMLKARIDQEELDNQRIDKAGWAGVPLGILAGILSPTIFIPVGAGANAIRGGMVALKTGASVAAASAVQAGIQESILYGTQQTRTGEEVALNIGAATILGGLLGAGAGALLSRAERKALEETFQQDRVDMGNDLAPQPTPAGAQVADTRELELRSFGLDKIPGVDKIFKGALKRVFTGPPIRAFQQPVVSGRRVMADLAETPLSFKENVPSAEFPEGKATTQGSPVDRRAKMWIDGAKVKIADVLDKTYAKYYLGVEPEGYLGRQVAKVKGTAAAMMGGPQAKMSPKQFREAVGEAYRRKDTSDIPEVREAAETFRREISNPLRDLAMATKNADGTPMLPEGVNVDQTAESHLTRVYKKERMVAIRPELQDDWADWLGSEQEHNAGLKAKLEANMADRDAKAKQLRKLVARQETAQLRHGRVEMQLSERQMEATATERRFDTVEARQQEAQQSLDEIKEFIADLREQTNTPEIAKQISALEQEAKSLEGGMKAITEKDLTSIDRAERQGILTGPMRRVARIMTGTGAGVKGLEPFWKYVARLGGVKDTGGDLQAMLGEKVTAKGGKGGSKALFNPKGLQWDDLQQKLADSFKTLEAKGWGKAGTKPSEDFSDEIRQAIVDSRNGKEPEWFLLEKGNNTDDEFVVSMVNELDRLSQMGEVPEFKTMDEFAKFFSGHHSGMTEKDYDNIIASLDEGPASMDTRVASLDVRAAAEMRAETIQVLKDSLSNARATRARALVKSGKADVRVDEAALGAARNMRRADILDKRSELASTQHSLLSAARQNLEDEIQALRVKAEEDLTAWRGKSSKEALYEMAKREEADRIRNLKQEAGVGNSKMERLTSADRAVDAAVKRIIASDRDLTPQELHARAGEWIDRTLGTPDGRLSYDAASGGPTVGAGKPGVTPRGSLAHRESMIPDERLNKFGVLENDIGLVLNRMVQTMVPDILLTEKFGDVNMSPALSEIRAEHEALALKAKTAAERTKLNNQFQELIADIVDTRDRIKGVYGYSGDYGSQNAARLVNAAKTYDVTTNLGFVAFSSLPDLAGPVLRHGFMSTMQNGWIPMLKYLTQLDGNAPEVRMAQKQFQAFGIAAESQTNSRLAALTEMDVEYHPRTKFERGLNVSKEVFMKATGLNLWTDKLKTIMGMVAQTEQLRAIEARVAGKATKKQITMLNEAGIDAEMSSRIFEHYSKPGGGTVINSNRFANSSQWADRGAAEAFNGGLARDIETGVITPGQEKPLWISKPVGSLLGQYKSFIAAASERLLLAGLQRHDFQTLQGVLFAVALGMMAEKAYSIGTGRPEPKRPQDWVKAGIDRSGMLAWFGEANAAMSALSSGRADVFRLIGADKPLTRYQSRSAASLFLGPTWGKIEDMLKIGGAASRGDWTAADTHRVRRLLAFQNLIWLRQTIDDAERGINKALNIPGNALPGPQSSAQPTAQPATQVAAKQGGDLKSIMAALKAPRKPQTDMAGRVTGVFSADLPEMAADPRLQELLDMLRKPKKFETGPDGSVKVSIA